VSMRNVKCVRVFSVFFIAIVPSPTASRFTAGASGFLSFEHHLLGSPITHLVREGRASSARPRQCAGSSTLTDAGIKQPSLLLGIHSEKRSACGASQRREGCPFKASSMSSAHNVGCPR